MAGFEATSIVALKKSAFHRGLLSFLFMVPLANKDLDVILTMETTRSTRISMHLTIEIDR